MESTLALAVNEPLLELMSSWSQWPHVPVPKTLSSFENKQKKQNQSIAEAQSASSALHRTFVNKGSHSMPCVRVMGVAGTFLIHLQLLSPYRNVRHNVASPTPFRPVPRGHLESIYISNYILPKPP